MYPIVVSEFMLRKVEEICAWVILYTIIQSALIFLPLILILFLP
jgi:hypothetical protein